MKKWEYKKVAQCYEIDEWSITEYHGKEGWELVCCYVTDEYKERGVSYIYIFKREL